MLQTYQRTPVAVRPSEDFQAARDFQSVRDCFSHKDRLPGKYLTLRLGKEAFGIEVRNVREIMDFEDITTVAGPAVDVERVIDLRGGIPQAPFTRSTCFIVVQVSYEGQQAILGLIVDGVSPSDGLT
jgi:chemotaxis signal transduction protein